MARLRPIARLRATIGVVQAGDHLRERVDRIEHATAERTGMQILLRSIDVHFENRETTEANAERGNAAPEHRCVAHANVIGLELFRFLAHERIEVVGSDLFFTFMF